MKQNLKALLLLAIIIVAFAHRPCLAQDYITFTGKDSHTAAVVRIDSIQIRNSSRQKDPTISSASFKIDWPGTTGTGQVPSVERFALRQNYPNSFGSKTAF